MNTVPFVAELTKMIPPPSRIELTGTPTEWRAVQQILGFEFPHDYVELIKAYGVGGFCTFLGLFNPFEANNGLIDKQEYLQKEFCPEGWFHFRKPRRRAIFPSDGGLIWIGGDEFGHMLFWVTEGEPDKWGIAYSSICATQYDEFPCGVTEFLVRFFRNEISPRGVGQFSKLNKPLCFEGIDVMERKGLKCEKRKLEDVATE